MSGLSPRLSAGTLQALSAVIRADPPAIVPERLGGYRSARAIKDFFEALGVRVSSPPGESRSQLVMAGLHRSNGSESIATIVEGSVSGSAFVDRPEEQRRAATYLNQHLLADGLRLSPVKGGYRLERIPESDVEAPASDPSAILTDAYVREQIEKCDRKLSAGDHDGAITNARTLLEAVLFAIELKLSGTRTPHGGDLAKLFKQVTKGLHMDVDRNMNERFKDVVRGLGQVVAGLSPLRNSRSDAHATVVKPPKHHAALVVNASKTLALFLVDSFNFQVARGVVLASGGGAQRSDPT